ncbi:MAG: class I SAM-dependent methyltransferase [Patescibacteria group bacterium]
MGNWDSIYQQYQQGGDAWATLSEGIDPRFISLIATSNFSFKHALDIGCGTGKYLAFLEDNGFRVDGIDSSPTAIEMTQGIVSKQAKLQVADMYSFPYPENTYDLILSVSTLHHGRKVQIANTIQKISSSLVPSGRIFITLPNLDASKTWETFKDQTEIESGTYSPNSGPEAGLPHSFFTEPEIHNLFQMFKDISFDLDKIGRWFITGSK